MGIPIVVTEVSKISRQESVEVVRSVPQERISERMGIIEVPEISCQRSAEVVKSILQERSPERRCPQSEVIKATETTSQDLEETGHETRRGSGRGSVKREGKGEKEENPPILKQVEEGGAEFV